MQDLTPTSAIVSAHLLALVVLGVASLLLLAWALRRHAAAWPAVVAGGCCFIVAALVLKPLFQRAIGLDIGWHWWAFASTAALLAGIFEESGRALGLKLLGAASAGAQARVWLFGLGYAGSELWLVGVLSHGQLLLLAHDPTALEQARSVLPPSAYQQLVRSMAALDAVATLWLVVERGSAAILQLALTAGVWIALQRRSWRLLAAIALAHAAADLPAALYQAGQLPLWLVESIHGAAGLLVLPWVLRTLVPARPRPSDPTPSC